MHPAHAVLSTAVVQAEADEIRGAYLAEPTARLAASQAELQEALDAPHGLPQEV